MKPIRKRKRKKHIIMKVRLRRRKMGNKVKRKFGDRRDARRVRDNRGLQCIMPHLLPNRTDAEVFLSDKFDVTELLKYIDEKNEEIKNRGEDYKITLFHCIVFSVTKMIMERPLLNRFIQGRRLYERNEVSMSFVAKRRFTDHAEEALMVLVPKETDTIFEVAKKIYGDVLETRKSEVANGGIDGIMTSLSKLPMFILAMVVGIVRFLDFWGINPSFLTEGDPNYTTVLLSNLGSIKCPSVYHHLNNYGTNSLMITIGTIHKEEVLMPDCTKQVRDMVDFGATLDERIGDGFYFARSLKLVKYFFENPTMMEKSLSVPSGFIYK